jgi:hypothetical protein
MPRKQLQRVRKVTGRRINNIHRAVNRSRSRRSTKQAHQTISTHRRLVLYPNHSDANWLSTIAWFSGVALKLLKYVVGINDDFTADERILSSGSAIFLGPGDFAAFSPFASPAQLTATDKEVQCLKSFPFERVGLRHVTLKIVPSADVSVRGGMYAALLQRIDPIDAQNLIDIERAETLSQKYVAQYEDIIKHPKAKLGPVTSTLKLGLNLDPTPHNIRVHWCDEKGFTNVFPNCVLLVAFSDMAAIKGNVDAGYSPTKALFEVHMSGDLTFHEPSSLPASQAKTADYLSLYTPKLMTTNSASINAQTSHHSDVRTVAFLDQKYEMSGPLNLFEIPRKQALQMLDYYNKTELKKEFLKRISNDNIKNNVVVPDYDMCDY